MRIRDASHVDVESRHPNYFFEWVIWLGVALVTTASPWGWVSWLVPAALPVPPAPRYGDPGDGSAELRSREDYAEYQRTTSAFVPFPPRRLSSGGQTSV